MRNHTLNMYRISNLADLNFSYKLVQFDLPSYNGNDELHNKHLQKIALEVSSHTNGPAAIVNREQKKFIAIPASQQLEDLKIDVGPLVVSLKLLPDVYHIKSSATSDDNNDVIYRFLDYEIRRQLTANQQLWKLNANQFFEKRPKPSNEESGINIFAGFSYRLLRLQDGYFYIVLDLSSKYIDKKRLSNYVNHNNVSAIGKRFIGKRFLYLNGDNWYATELMGFGEKISTHEFSLEGKTWKVRDYILSKPSSRKNEIESLLKPDDLAMSYRYPGRAMEPHNGASSLAKMLYSTDDPEVRALHRLSIKEPARRFESIGKFIGQYFQNIQFDGKLLSVSRSPVIERINSFQLPNLKYNNDKILKIGNFHDGGNSSVKDFGFDRKSFIERNGVINTSPFDTQYLIVPSSLDRNLVEAFKKNAEAQIKKLAPKFTSFKVIRYTYKEGIAATLQIQEIEKILTQQNALTGFALFILPDVSSESRRNIRNFHNCLKNKFYPDLKLQCASAFKISSYFIPCTQNGGNGNLIEYRVPEENKPRFRGYLFNLVMELLIVNRKWPFALENSLKYDIYIGVDVHERYAGFTFFLKNGEHIFFTHEQVPRKNRSQRSEKLKAALLYKVIYEKLKLFIPSNCPNPNGIVILRDGRSFGEEQQALEKVIADLENEGLLQGSIVYGVVDLHKQSAVPLRLAAQTNSHQQLENPKAGSYKLVNPNEGFVFNTGYPFNIKGSAKPLHLTLKAGNVEFLKVMEDVFCQSMLAFSAPDRSNSLPIGIKLIDTLLEPLAASVEEMEEEENEFEELA